MAKETLDLIQETVLAQSSPFFAATSSASHNNNNNNNNDDDDDYDDDDDDNDNALFNHVKHPGAGGSLQHVREPQIQKKFLNLTTHATNDVHVCQDGCFRQANKTLQYQA